LVSLVSKVKSKLHFVERTLKPDGFLSDLSLSRDRDVVCVGGDVL
jgi:hypothetical protein